ncbi:MAG: UDP-N-acetylglucosamine 1-carboxyvinyltransferase [Candidatus Sungbacteria bacterium]|uniref:UDP-N-acetylglucosamine 1-carboxyvinyltransferase n=1 Tax=Candidatus Sungiibacteriota bacterium TaxID=2750080 RepID=A0A9D6LS65_9BACT|nr:UDP-N-acetylglucosamine 1-carboxyvinyltransferase [Candidatus Sungbacteria bacterium]
MRPLSHERVKIGSMIASRRETLGLTQKDLARRLKTSQSAVARMERGDQNFSTVMLLRISKVLAKSIISVSGASLNFEIEGGHRLSGKIKTNSAKNSAVVLLAASLLNRGRTVLRSMPKIEEVRRLIEILESLGVYVRWQNEKDLEIIPPQRLNLKNLNIEAAKKTRSILLFLGPLIHLARQFSIPEPGGCRLGLRTARPHFLALREFGVNISSHEYQYDVVAKNLHPAEVVLYESGDTVTENAIMAAAGIPGKTMIKFASANYMGQELCFFLELLGVKIEGIGTSTLTVEGIETIQKDVSYHLAEDPIESMLFLSIAATTNSPITIERCPIDFLELELLKLKEMGFRYKILKRYVSSNGRTKLVDIKTFLSRLTALPEKIYARPFPGINIDNLPFFVPIATQARGETLIHDWVFENRAVYYLELTKLGASVTMADPHRVFIKGPTKLTAAEVICPPALRPSALILIAMLAATGTSILRNVYSINRGYEDLTERLQKLGAKIKVLRSF